MKKRMLSIENLVVEVEGKRVLKGVSLEVGKGEIVVLMGPNGSGKSSLAMTLLGSSEYKIVKEKKTRVEFEGKNLLTMSIDERARAGLYLAWQNPVAIPGVSVFSLGKAAYQAMREARGETSEYKSLSELKERMRQIMEKVGLSEIQLEKGVNEGFSGGEKKRLELVQLMLLKPKLAILDEIDSGLDKKGKVITREIVSELREEGTSFMIITHDDSWGEGENITRQWVMKNGKLQTGR
ncbi:MAG: Fe-S cluster assembly ATPase SufC [bacterium]